MKKMKNNWQDSVLNSSSTQQIPLKQSVFWKKDSPDELSAFYSERHVTVLICLPETCQALFERHYMYARAKFTKNNKQSINWAWSQMTEEKTGFPNCHRV